MWQWFLQQTNGFDGNVYGNDNKICMELLLQSDLPRMETFEVLDSG